MAPEDAPASATPIEASPLPEPLVPSTGLGVLHLFAKVGAGADLASVERAVKDAEAAGYTVITVALLGHKADLGLVVLGPDVVGLRRLQSAVNAAGLDIVGSYFSLTEVSEYAAGIPEEMRQARLYPNLPPAAMPAFCFYPMSKRRGEQYNWYELGFDERKELMTGHGKVGRTFHGRVVQLVTGSTGIDDWEWGVTLFATAHDDLKDCVYTMRFDEASSRYAEFGPFWTGFVGETSAVLSLLEGR